MNFSNYIFSENDIRTNFKEGDFILLINKSRHPVDSLFYIAACVANELKKKSKEVFTDDLYETILNGYNNKLSYSDFILSLNFLFLINKIHLTERGIGYVYT